MSRPAESQNERNGVDLLGPKKLVLTVRSYFGPFAARFQRSVKSPVIDFQLSNRRLPAASDETELTPVKLSLEPLSRDRDGAVVQSQLTLRQNGATVMHAPDSATVRFVESESLAFQIQIEGKLPPEVYVSSLTARHADATCALKIPIQVRVAAHWIWPGCLMLAGLMLLGMLNWLAGVSEVHEQRAKVLRARQTFHETLNASPPSQHDNELVDRIESEFARTLEVSNMPRGWGLTDRRPSLVEYHLTNAGDGFSELESRLRNQNPAEKDVAQLEEQWEQLRRRVRQVSSELAKCEQQFDVTPSGADNAIESAINEWRDSLALSLQKQREAFLEQPLNEFEIQFHPQVQLIRVALVRGERLRAQDAAVRAGSWLRRAAGQMEGWIRLLLGIHSYAREMEGDIRVLVAALNDQSIPNEKRKAVANYLAAANVALDSRVHIQGFKECFDNFEKAKTLLFDEASNYLVAQVDAAMNTVAKQTSVEHIDVAWSNLTPPANSLNEEQKTEEKKKGLLGIVELWSELVASCKSQDPAAAQRLSDAFTTIQEHIGETQQHIEAGDFQSAATGFRNVSQLRHETAIKWKDEVAQRMQIDYCNYLENDLRKHLPATEARLRLVELAGGNGLQLEVDQIWTAIDQVDEQKRLPELVGLHKNLIEVDGKIFEELLSLQNLTPEARLAAATTSGVPDAVAFARRVMSEPWPLHVTLRSTREELYAGHLTTVAIGHLDPGWLSDVGVTIDFGDGSAAIQKTADEIRRQPVVEHRYKSPRRYTIKVAADRQLSAGLSERVGEGEVSAVIAPSPVSAAQVFADTFFHLQFFLALAVAILIQTWRYYGEQPFGSRGRDYVEAFAWGVGIDATVRGLTGVFDSIGPFA